MRRKTKIMLLASATAGFMSYLIWQPSFTQPEIAATSVTEANFYFNQVAMTQYGKDGQLINRVNAASMSHFEKTEHSIIDSPNVILRDKNNVIWEISAVQGNLNHQTNQLDLEQEITIDINNENTETRLRTQTLLVDLLKKTASTESPIEIYAADSETRAVGMLADIEAGHVSLNSQVQSTHKVPNP